MEQITTFRDETRELLLQRPIHISTAKIAKELKVSEKWVSLFANGKTKNPGVCTIETLNAFLKQEIRKAAKNVR